MNIFDQLKDIITDKQNKLSEDIEFEKEFVPFMTQRWLSFYSDQFAHLLNCSTNMLWRGIEEKPSWYKLFTGIIPKTKYRNIRYIKKNKEEKPRAKIDKDVVIYLAERFNISKREVNEYIETGMIDVKQIKKQLQSD